MAAGSYGDLAIVYSTPQLESTARKFAAELNEELVFVIQTENLFNIDIFSPDKWELAKGYKNSIFLVDLNQGGGVAKAAKKQLSKKSWEQLHNGGGGLVQRRDPWSSYQLMIVAAASDRNSLGSLLHRSIPRLRMTLANDSRTRILRRNRYHGLATGLINACWETYGFYMEIPSEFQRTQQGHDGVPGLELMRTGPSRGITITWREFDDPVAKLSDHAALLDIRREMGTKFHHEELVTESLRWEEEGLGGKGGVKLSGAWSGTDFAGGGPFWSYFVAAPDQGRIYCLDLLVYAPGMDKMVFFRQMEAIASTFSTTQPQP